MIQHSDSYNEHLLYARRLGGGSSSSPSSSDENPQEAPTPATPAVGNGRPPSAGESEETFIQKYLSLIITAILALSLVGVVFIMIPYYAVQSGKQGEWDRTLYWTAGFFVLIAVPVSAHGIVKHLVNYYMPQVQKYVIRILFMVPIFSIQSWFSLFFHTASSYLEGVRSLYEAFVLSSFVYYIIELLGGEDQLSATLRTKSAHHGDHTFPFKYFCSSWRMGRQFMINCKYGLLQYVLIKIISTIIVPVLSSRGMFDTGDWAINSAHLWISLLLNVSMGYALYCLFKLYYATKEDLREWNPLWKFLCIKGIIFFTFWQGFLIEVLHSFGVIQGVGDWDSGHVVDGLQDFLISFEMVFFAVAHSHAFPHTDYVHYLQRKQSSSSKNASAQGDETLFLFDQNQNVVDDSRSIVDVEYEPPTVRQLDRPMSVSQALLGVVPGETISDIARMGGSVVAGQVSRQGASDSRGSRHGDIVFSRDHAEGI